MHIQGNSYADNDQFCGFSYTGLRAILCQYRKKRVACSCRYEKRLVRKNYTDSIIMTIEEQAT